MALSDCSKCWETPCVCGHDYKDRSVQWLERQIVMLQKVLENKQKEQTEAPGEKLWMWANSI